MKYKIPEIIIDTAKTLIDAGFEAYLVGGCVRDLLLNEIRKSEKVTKPKDWDITTNANPEQIQKLFPKTVYENKFGTVAVVNESAKNDETLRIIEITPYRLESKYSDKRHPDKVKFTDNLSDDLKRRDFTINAMAMNPVSREIVDIFNGREDLERGIIRAVGEPEERFEEDALRILRAIRLATEMDFTIHKKTQDAIKNKAGNLRMIAMERIRDEFIKIIMAPKPSTGIIMMKNLGVLKYIIPELEEGYGIKQNKAHKFTVWEHNLRSLDHAASKNWRLEIRLASLFHDIGKPISRRWNNQKKDWTFYGHDVVGGRITAKIMSRLKFPKKTIELVSKLVRYHLFFSETETITLSAVRRTVRNVGPENIWDLMKVRFCDRIGMGRPKEAPYRLRKYEAMIEEAMRSPISVTMLKINGEKIMKITGEKPGPKIGFILHILLEETFNDPRLNTPEYLEKRAKELAKIPQEKLMKMAKKAMDVKEEKEKKEIETIRKKWWVK